jgi:hypothetical protein
MADSDQTQKLLKEIADSLQAAGSGATNTLNKFSSSIDQNTKRFAGAMNAGVAPITQTIATIGQLGAAVPVLGKVFQSLTSAGGNVVQYFEDSITTYQTLSKVGAGLSGNLNQLRASVTDSRLGLQGFTEFVSKNSQDLIRFGGSADQGAMMLGKIGNSLRDTGMDVRFEQLGFTTEELTEFTTKYLAQNQRSARMEGKSMEEQITRAARYAKQLTTMSRLTGESIQSMQDDINNRKKAGATQAALQLAEIQGGKGAVKAYEESQGALRQAAPVVQNLLDDLIQTGAPMSDATRNFAALNSETYGLLQEAAAATKRGDIETAKKLSEKAAAEAAAFAQSEEGLRIAALAQVSDVAQTQADAFEEIGPIIDRVKGGVENLGEIAGDSGKFLDAWNKQVEASRQEIQNVYDSLSEGGNIRRTVQAGQRATTDATVEAQRRVNETAFGAEVDYADQMQEFQYNISQGIATDFSKQAMNSINTLTNDILGLQSDDKVLEYLKEMSAEEREANGISDETISKFEKYLSQPVGQEKSELRKELGPEFFDKQTGVLEGVRNTLKAQKQEQIDAVRMQEDATTLQNYDNLNDEEKQGLDYGVQTMPEEAWDKLKSMLDAQDVEKFEEIRKQQPEPVSAEVPVSATDVVVDGTLQVTLTPDDFNVTVENPIPVATASETSKKSDASLNAENEEMAIGTIVNSVNNALDKQNQLVDGTLQTLAENEANALGKQNQSDASLNAENEAMAVRTIVNSVNNALGKQNQLVDGTPQTLAENEEMAVGTIVNSVNNALDKQNQLVDGTLQTLAENEEMAVGTIVNSVNNALGKQNQSDASLNAENEEMAVGTIVNSVNNALDKQNQLVDGTLQTLAESKQDSAESSVTAASTGPVESTLVNNIAKTVQEATKNQTITESAQTASTNKNDSALLKTSINDLIAYLRERDNAAKAQTATLDAKSFQPLIDKLDLLYSINTSVNTNLVKIASAMKNEAKYV